MTNKNLFSFESCSQMLVKIAYTKNILQADYIFLEDPSLKLRCIHITCTHVLLQHL